MALSFLFDYVTLYSLLTGNTDKETIRNAIEDLNSKSGGCVKIVEVPDCIAELPDVVSLNKP